MLSNIDEIGKRIKEKRISLGISIKGLSDTSGIAEASISRYEAGKQQPNLETIVSLANALDTSIDYLVRGNGENAIFHKPAKSEYGHEIASSILTLTEYGLVDFEANMEEGYAYLNLRPNKELIEFFGKAMDFVSLSTNMSASQRKSLRQSLITKYGDAIIKESDYANSLLGKPDYMEYDQYRELCKIVLDSIRNKKNRN